VSSEDGRWLAIGTSTGEVTLYPTTSWKPVPVLTARGAIRSIAMSPDLTMMSILSDDGLAHLVPFPSATAAWDPGHWDTVELAARTAAFSPDGRLLAITARDGGVFFYSVPRRTWRYIAFAATPILDGQWAADSNRYATVDASGRAIQLELARLRD
jgi:WD40 repeat protein